MKEYSPKQTAAMKARVRRMRARYRRLMIAAIVIFFILGAVAGVFAHRWYVKRTPAVDATLLVTPSPESATDAGIPFAPQQTPEAWAMPEEEASPDEMPEIFPEDAEEDADAGAELDAFPEVDSTRLTEDEEDEAAGEDATDGAIAPGEPLVPQPDVTANAAPVLAGADESVEDGATVAPDAGADAPAANETEAAQVPGADEAPKAEAGDAPPQDPAQDGEDSEDGEDREDGEAPAGEDAAQPASNSYGPQVVAIVPYGESFTYTTEINAGGNARVEATDAPYETLCFTQTMLNYMRPTDYAAKYATTYRLQGDEAGASFELVLNDYIGDTTIIPQNVVDVSLRSESGDTVEHGYQLMDAEIDGKYGIALPTNTPKTFYKRFAYSNEGEEMKYLVITTYKNGQTQMILFEMESNEPEPEPETIYPVLQRGLNNDDVLNLQNRLVELGYLSGTADGNFGQKTEDAIKSAQAAFGMEQTGIADSAFQQKLYEGVAPAAGEGEGYVALSEGSTGDAVVRLQKRLAELGYYSGRADGGYGPMMAAAVKKAQVAFGMEQTGIADSEFQQRVFADVVAEDGGESLTGYIALDRNSKGEAVVRLQLALREQGFYNGKADGGYGKQTEDAVKKAQAAYGLEQTGIADITFQQHLFGSVVAQPEDEDGSEETEEDEGADDTENVG